MLGQHGLSPQLVTGNEPNFVVHKFNILNTILIVIIIIGSVLNHIGNNSLSRSSKNETRKII